MLRQWGATTPKGCRQQQTLSGYSCCTCRCFKPRCHRSVLQELKKEVNELEETIPVPATSMCPPEAGKVGNQQQGWSGIKSEHLELDLDSMSDHDGEATPHYSEPAPCNMFI